MKLNSLLIFSIFIVACAVLESEGAQAKKKAVTKKPAAKKSSTKPKAATKKPSTKSGKKTTNKKPTKKPKTIKPKPSRTGKKPKKLPPPAFFSLPGGTGPGLAEGLMYSPVPNFQNAPNTDENVANNFEGSNINGFPQTNNFEVPLDNPAFEETEEINFDFDTELTTISSVPEKTRVRSSRGKFKSRSRKQKQESFEEEFTYHSSKIKT